MANELQITITQFSFQKGNVGVGTVPGSRQITVSGNNAQEGQLPAVTTDVVLAKGNVASIGWLWIENLNQAGTDALLIGPDGVSYPIQFLPGEGGLFRWNQTNVHVKSGGASITAYYIMVDA